MRHTFHITRTFCAWCLKIVFIQPIVAAMSETDKNQQANNVVKGALGGAFFASLINPALLPIAIGTLIGAVVGPALAGDEDDRNDDDTPTQGS